MKVINLLHLATPIINLNCYIAIPCKSNTLFTRSTKSHANKLVTRGQQAHIIKSVAGYSNTLKYLDISYSYIERLN